MDEPTSKPSFSSEKLSSRSKRVLGVILSLLLVVIVVLCVWFTQQRKINNLNTDKSALQTQVNDLNSKLSEQKPTQTTVQKISLETFSIQDIGIKWQYAEPNDLIYEYRTDNTNDSTVARIALTSKKIKDYADSHGESRCSEPGSSGFLEITTKDPNVLYPAIGGIDSKKINGKFFWLNLLQASCADNSSGTASIESMEQKTRQQLKNAFKTLSAS